MLCDITHIQRTACKNNILLVMLKKKSVKRDEMLVTFSSRLLTFSLPTGDMIQYNSCLLVNES